MIPPGADARTVTTSAGGLRVLHAGAPRPGRIPVVLVHGGGGDAAAISWYRLLGAFGADREAWAIDLPGFGGSIGVAPVGGARALAAVVAEVIASVVDGPVAVVGVSMGGDVVLNLALDRPGITAGVIAIAPGGLIPIFRNPLLHRLAWWAARLPDRVLLPAARWSNRFARSAIRTMVADPGSLPPEVVDEFVRMSAHRDGALGYLRYNQASIGRDRMLNDLSDRMAGLRAPTLLFHGEGDRLVDPDGSRRAAAALPDGELVLQPRCGHWAQLEAHDAFLSATRAFLARLDGPSRDDACRHLAD